MPVVSDKGLLRNRINSNIANIISLILGQRLNYIIRYYSHRHRIPNFKHPKDLSERLLSAMLKKDFLRFAEYADKVKVRDYIKSKGLEEILLNQYGVWENANDIDFSKLPDRFILKANNGSGGHIICTDKSKLNIKIVTKELNNSLNHVQILKRTEPHYGAIKPLILCEELIGDGIELPIDYKFHCINGVVQDIFIASEREKTAKYSTLNKNWEELPYTISTYKPTQIPPKPDNLDKMIRIAEILSGDFEFVRVDLYNHKNKIYFGELTFSPWGGIMNSYTTEALEILGAKFND